MGGVVRRAGKKKKCFVLAVLAREKGKSAIPFLRARGRAVEKGKREIAIRIQLLARRAKERGGQPEKESPEKKEEGRRMSAHIEKRWGSSLRP